MLCEIKLVLKELVFTEPAQYLMNDEKMLIELVFLAECGAE